MESPNGLLLSLKKFKVSLSINEEKFYEDEGRTSMPGHSELGQQIPGRIRGSGTRKGVHQLAGWWNWPSEWKALR
jgi:hypothetical protein